MASHKPKLTAVAFRDRMRDSFLKESAFMEDRENRSQLRCGIRLQFSAC